jgi:alkanesulfonate monooxygenase SsuD/methylene tetrahydromethanopterin reductase-like flavin-dependent oxidoreductase (luciferase family)
VFQLDGFAITNVEGATVPVFNGALGRTNLAMTIDYADGWIPHLFPLPALEAALADARDRAATTRMPHVCPSVPTAINENPSEAQQLLTEHITSYVGSAEFYRDVIADNGFPEEANAIHEAWQNGDREAAVSAVTRDLLDAIGIAGTPSYGRKRLESILETVDSVLISFPRGGGPELYRTVVEALEPALD